MARAETERRVFVANRRAEDRRRVLDWIEDRNVVRAVFRRTVERSVGVDGRVALVGRDQIVQVVLVVHPVAQRDDDVALDTLRPRWLRERQLALGDALGPVPEVLERRPGRAPRAGRASAGPTGRTARGASRPPRATRRCREQAGIVRVESWPSWWQPTQPLFFIWLSQSVCVSLAGMLLFPPNWSAPGIFSIEYQ